MINELESLTHQQCVPASVSFRYWRHSLSPHRRSFIKINRCWIRISSHSHCSMLCRYKRNIANIKQCTVCFWIQKRVYIFYFHITLSLNQVMFSSQDLCIDAKTKNKTLTPDPEPGLECSRDPRPSTDHKTGDKELYYATEKVLSYSYDSNIITVC